VPGRVYIKFKMPSRTLSPSTVEKKNFHEVIAEDYQKFMVIQQLNIKMLRGLIANIRKRSLYTTYSGREQM
jgi:hypothetical protein